MTSTLKTIAIVAGASLLSTLAASAAVYSQDFSYGPDSLRAGVIAGLCKQGRAIEVGDEEQGMLAIHRDPNLVELAGEIGLVGAGELLCRRDQFVEGERSGRDLLQSRHENRLRHGNLPAKADVTRPRAKLG